MRIVVNPFENATISLKILYYIRLLLSRHAPGLLYYMIFNNNIKTFT